jgi:hypothetical protein
MSSSVVKNDAKRVPPSREHLAHAMTHGNPIMTADAPRRAMMDGKHDGVALAQWNTGCLIAGWSGGWQWTRDGEKVAWIDLRAEADRLLS